MKSTLITLTLGTLLLSGCATQSDVERAKQEVLASVAITNAKAEQALECCSTNRQAIDRMYQKIMSK